MRIIRKLKAKRAGVPFEIKRFWPAGIKYTGNGRSGMTLIWPDTQVFEPRLVFDPTRPNRGDVVPVWFKDGMAHFYRITSTGRASGSDHIIDPTEYNLEYAHSTSAQLVQAA